MAKARRFTVTVDGKTLVRTSLSRVYAFAVVGTPDIELAGRRAARIAPEASDRSNFDWYSFMAAQQPGMKVAPPNWGGRETAFSAEEIENAKALIVGGLDGYMARDQQRRMAAFEAAKQRGAFTPDALTWCSRLDLAQKAIGQFKGYVALRIMPVEG